MLDHNKKHATRRRGVFEVVRCRFRMVDNLRVSMSARYGNSTQAEQHQVLGIQDSSPEASVNRVTASLRRVQTRVDARMETLTELLRTQQDAKSENVPSQFQQSLGRFRELSRE